MGTQTKSEAIDENQNRFLQEKVDNNQSQEKRMFHCIIIRTSIRKSSLYIAWKEVKSSDECL